MRGKDEREGDNKEEREGGRGGGGGERGGRGHILTQLLKTHTHKRYCMHTSNQLNCEEDATTAIYAHIPKSTHQPFPRNLPT